MSNYPHSLPNGDVQDPDEDSELLCELFTVLENHGVDEGLREMIMDLVARWEMENDNGGDLGPPVKLTNSPA